MVVLRSASGVVQQLLYGQNSSDNNNPHLFIRRNYNGWTSWDEIILKSDLTWSNIGEKPGSFTPSSHTHSTSDVTSGTLGTARGGTGITSNPSMLVNLASTSAASVFATSPRPGVTGTLPIANGGTGATSASAARTALGITPANIGAAASSHTHSYLPLSGGTMSGDIAMGNHSIGGLSRIYGSSSTTNYIAFSQSGCGSTSLTLNTRNYNGGNESISLGNQTITLNCASTVYLNNTSGGTISACSKRIQNVATPTSNNDATNKQYIDNNTVKIYRVSYNASNGTNYDSNGVIVGRNFTGSNILFLALYNSYMTNFGIAFQTETGSNTLNGNYRVYGLTNSEDKIYGFVAKITADRIKLSYQSGMNSIAAYQSGVSYIQIAYI